MLDDVSDVKNTVTPLPLAWQDWTFEKLELFDLMSDEDEIYMKIVALDEIYYFVVLSFFIWGR